jgi:two-component system, OmpR family, response regulator RegX3
MRVLLIADASPALVRLEAALVRQGYETSQTSSFTIAAAMVPQSELVVLDLDLSGADAHEICRQVRSTSMVPIITLTGSADEADRLVSLRLGADDCVTKPYSVQEVVTRIYAISRRSHFSASRNADRSELRVGSMTIEPKARRVFIDGVEVGLTRKEFDLLTYLVENADVVCDRRRIMQRVWDQKWFGSTRTVDVHVGALRRKLGPACRIETVRGIGFRLGRAGADSVAPAAQSIRQTDEDQVVHPAG